MIRFATEKDLHGINRLRKQVNDLHVQGRPDIFKDGFARELEEYAAWYLQSPDNDILVCERDGAIVGMVMVDYIAKPETPYSLARAFCHIAEICVDEQCRRQGIAHSLLEAVRDEARKRGLNKMELDVWAFNDALDFYTSEGFRVYRRYLECDL